MQAQPDEIERLFPFGRFASEGRPNALIRTVILFRVRVSIVEVPRRAVLRVLRANLVRFRRHAHPYGQEKTNATLALSPASSIPHPRLSDAPAIVDKAFEVDWVETPHFSQFDRWQDGAPSTVGMFNDPSAAHAELFADIRDCEEFSQTVHTPAS